MADVLYYQNYTVVADIFAIVLCLIFYIILKSSYTEKRKTLFLFYLASALISLAAASNILFHYYLPLRTHGHLARIYITRGAYYAGLMFVFVIICFYLGYVMDVDFRDRKVLRVLIWLGAVAGVIVQGAAPFSHYGFYIDKYLRVHQNYYNDPFRYVYVYYCILILWILFTYRKKLISSMFRCILKVFALSFLVMVLQYQFLSTSYTCMTFVFPMLVVLFLFHYNAYDIETGMLDYRAFGNYTKELNGKDFIMLSLYLRDLSAKKRKQLTPYFFHFNKQFFYNPCTFRMKDGQFVMIIKDDENKNADGKISRMLEDFEKLYQKFKADYKIAIIHSDKRLVSGDDYLTLSDYIEGKTSINEVTFVTKEDIDVFIQRKYILTQLHDIHEKQDLEDERILIYCQPVRNTKTGVFSTAEVLMRLNVPGLGMVMPDTVIPLAEKYELIHTISKIVLNKTCKNIKQLETEGYEITRISVNFSITELNDEDFCEDLLSIMNHHGVSYDKIAVELTESRNEKDFEIMKQVMNRLQTNGVRFYLDDFGTGYSNFERIIELPIDIIKFDKSLTALSGKNANSRNLVGSFSDIFTRSNYQVLFEGVETEDDEMRCENMNALYLQGYKYSKPIPMMELRDFLPKRV